jgi:hypothetical protein
MYLLCACVRGIWNIFILFRNLAHRCLLKDLRNIELSSMSRDRSRLSYGWMRMDSNTCILRQQLPNSTSAPFSLVPIDSVWERGESHNDKRRKRSGGVERNMARNMIPRSYGQRIDCSSLLAKKPFLLFSVKQSARSWEIRQVELRSALAERSLSGEDRLLDNYRTHLLTAVNRLNANKARWSGRRRKVCKSRKIKRRAWPVSPNKNFSIFPLRPLLYCIVLLHSVIYFIILISRFPSTEA